VLRSFYRTKARQKYSGINMWRGVTLAAMLSGSTMVRIGWHRPAKLLLYPIRNAIDADGRQLFNWVVDIETDQYQPNDWNRPGNLADFIGVLEDWKFDWLDVPAFIRSADRILEYPMVDQDPLPRWNFGRLTLPGDAAHPMYPRGANGAAQAILDARRWPTR
jgi:2-polyprenyl-6-methoxyphenol hydroxylase-like FAD-dependent oxidoreductase